MRIFQIETTRDCDCESCRTVSTEELKDEFFQKSNPDDAFNDTIFLFDERITFSHQKEETMEISKNDKISYRIRTSFARDERKNRAFVESFEISEMTDDRSRKERKLKIWAYETENSNATDFFKTTIAENGRCEKYVDVRLVFEYRHKYPCYFFELKREIVKFLIKLRC